MGSFFHVLGSEEWEGPGSLSSVHPRSFRNGSQPSNCIVIQVQGEGQGGLELYECSVTSCRYHVSVRRSRLPSPPQKGLRCALTTTADIIHNLRSVVWGVGTRRYPHPCRMSALLCLFKEAGLGRLVPLDPLRGWVLEGRNHPAHEPPTNPDNPMGGG